MAGAPVMDFVFTVCDDAAGEMWPVWPGQAITAHWGIADPVAVDGADWERVSLTVKLREIGHAEGASSPRPNVA